MTKPDQIAYHYSTFLHLEKIKLTGHLDPAASVMVGAGYREPPILWFSTHSYWEVTANKAVMEDGKIRRLTMEETYLKAGGLARVGYPAQKLHPWKGDKLRHKARMDKHLADGLTKAGIKQGADPNLWFGTCQAIPLSALHCIEIMDEERHWVRESG